jgi:drug/metabolite transporter (DMT)-like permease
MAINPRLGILSAFTCLGILGVLPILANARPAGFDGLTFTIWLTVWQILSALPLYLRERAQGQRGLFEAAGGGKSRSWTISVAVSTGVMFGLATYMYVVAAEKAGPVSMAIVLQAYPLMTMLAEAIFLKKRKTPAELGFTALMIVALVYLTTNGTFSIADISWWSVFALGIPALWTIAHLLLKTQVLDRTTMTLNQVTLSRLLVSGAFLAVLCLAVGSPSAVLAGLTDPGLQRAAFIMGLAYYVELIFWFQAIRNIDVSVASAIEVPSPAVTMLVAVLFAGVGVTPPQVLAMVAVVAGMYGLLFAGRAQRRRQAA